jgi:hypothetical protein
MLRYVEVCGVCGGVWRYVDVSRVMWGGVCGGARGIPKRDLHRLGVWIESFLRNVSGRDGWVMTRL